MLTDANAFAEPNTDSNPIKPQVRYRTLPVVARPLARCTFALPPDHGTCSIKTGCAFLSGREGLCCRFDIHSLSLCVHEVMLNRDCSVQTSKYWLSNSRV
jgi:hypothetical protein